MNALRSIAFVLACALATTLPAFAQPATAPDAGLQMVVIVSRHGVRSPTHPGELNAYARQPWAKWSGHPGYLTAQGATLMRQYGTYYRRMYGSLLGFGARGCPQDGAVFVWADVDQRTVATGDALLRGLAPGCAIAVQRVPGDVDRLFDPLPGLGVVNKAEATAAVIGAAGGDLGALPEAYGPTFAALERVVGCAAPSACKQVASVPTTVANDGDGGLAGLAGGLDVAADVAENLLLEYVDGHPSPGWGRLDRSRLVQLLQLHVLAKQLEHANRYSARAHSSNIMAHILQTLEEGVTGKAVVGTRVPPSSRFVFLSGHDTQLAELSGLLHVSWLVKGDQVNDTPPGGAIIFELHRSGEAAFVRTFFAAQTLDAMRAGHGENPVRVPLYIPGCPRLDCPFERFKGIVDGAIDPSFVAPW